MPVLNAPSVLTHCLTFFYVLDVLLLALYGFYALFQTLFYWRKHRSASEGSHSISTSQVGSDLTLARPDFSASDSGDPFPQVTIQLPVYNEQHVVQALIETVAQLDWPREKLQIQILDDSTDETTEMIRQQVEHLKSQPRYWSLQIEHHHRHDRTGFKAGALQQGLASATGEFIAIFDADFVPPSDFLQRTIPAFNHDKIACVQARWDHINPEGSLLTCAQSVGIDGHFVIEQQARHDLGALLNFNGTAGILRRKSLDAVGGWEGDTLTEDLDLSYRLQLQGWQITYLPQVKVPAELPVQLYALQRQQFRWAKGSIQTALKLGPSLWRSPASQEPQPLWRKVLGTLHLTQYAVHPLMVINLLLILPVGLNTLAVAIATPLVTLSALGPPFLYWTAMKFDGMPWPKRLRRLGMLLILGTGLSVNNSRAVLEALMGRKSEFQRTPKFAVSQRNTPWQTSNYVLSGGLQVWIELSLCLYAAALWIYCFSVGAWWVLPWLLLYAGGYATMICLTWIQTWQRNKLVTQQEESTPAPLSTPVSF